MRGRRILLAAVAVVVLLVGGLAAAVILIPEERVADAVAARAEAFLGQPVAIDRVGFSLFPVPGVRLSELTVGTPDSTALARVDRMEVRVRLLPLIGGRVVVRTLDLEGPRVAVEINRAGVGNFPVIEPDTGEAASTRDITFAVDRVRVTDGRIRYVNRQDSARVRLDGWNQELTVSGQTEAGELSSLELAGWVAFDDIAATLPDMVIPARNLALRVTHDAALDLAADRLDLQSLEVELDGVTLAGSGDVRGVNSGRPDVRLKLAAHGLDASRLMAWVPDSLQARLALPDGRAVGLRGTAAIDAVVDGTVAPGTLPDVDGTLTLDDAAVTLGSEPLLEAVGGRAAFSLDSVVARFDGRALGESFNAGVAVRNPADPLAVVAVSGRGQLGRLSALGLVADTLGVEGDLRIDLRTQLPLRTPADARAAGTIDVIGVTVAGADPVVRVPTATARFDGGRLRVGPVEMELGPDRSPLTLDVVADGWIPAAVDSTAPHPSVAATLDADTLDLDALLGPSESGYPVLLFARLRDRPVDGRSAAEVATELGLAVPPLPPVDARVEARIGELIRNGLHYTDLQATARVTADAVSMERLRFGFMGGQVDVNGRLEPTRVDSAGAPVMSRLSGRFGLTNVGARPFFDRLTPFKDHLAGRMDMAGTVEMLLDRHALPDRPSLGSAGSLGIADGRLASWAVLEAVAGQLGIAALDTLRFGDWAGIFRIDGPRVTLDETALQATDLDLQATGWFDFGGQLDVRATASLAPELARRAGAIGRQLAAAGVPIPVGLRIHGPVESPDVALDLAPARRAVAGRAREAVDEAVGEARETAEDAVEEAAGEVRRRAEEELQAAADRATGQTGQRVELPDSLRGLPADSLRQILGDSVYELLPDSVRLRADSLQKAIENGIRERLRRLLPGGGGGDGGGSDGNDGDG